MITIPKEQLQDLLNYIDTVLDYICLSDVEDADGKAFIKEEYDERVVPIQNMLYNIQDQS